MQLPKPAKEIPIHEWELNSSNYYAQIGNPMLQFDAISEDEEYILYDVLSVPTPQSGTSWPAGFVAGVKARTKGFMISGGLNSGATSDVYKFEALIDGEWVLVGRYNYWSDPMEGDFNEKIEEYIFHTTEIADLENELEALRAVNTNLVNVTNKLTDANLKLDSEIALAQGIRGAVVDIKNQPTDACIIRIYVGDQTKRREAAAREIERLLGEGYRPYQTFGISEDLARVLFVKYPEPNDANPVEP